MLSSRTARAMAACHWPRSRHIAIVALLVFAHCLPLGCASLPATEERAQVERPSGSEPVALGGIRVRMHASAASRQGPTIVYLGGPSRLPVSEMPAQVVEISRRGSALSPAFIVVAVGQNLKFRVVDDIHHHIFSRSKIGAFDLGSLSQGKTKQVRFERSGILRLYCSLHPAENAALYVSPSSHYAHVPASGEVVLRGLLPGSYELHTWHEWEAHPVVAVTVRAGQVSSVEVGAAASGAGE